MTYIRFAILLVTAFAVGFSLGSTFSYYAFLVALPVVVVFWIATPHFVGWSRQP